MLRLHDVRVQRKRTKQRLPSAPFEAVDSVFLEMVIFEDGESCLLSMPPSYQGVHKQRQQLDGISGPGAKRSGYVMSRCAGERVCGEDRSAEALAG